MTEIFRSIKISLLIFMMILSVKGQDMHFTQFYSTPLYLNPAFAGANVCSRVSLVYRNQWPGITRTYRSYLLSADHYFTKQNVGVGILFGNDVAGSGNLRTTLINPIFAYEVRLARNLGMRFGFQPGITIRSINFNSLIFGDQIANGGTTTETPTASKGFLDVSAGMLAYTNKYWGGLTVNHFNKPNESLQEGEDVTLPVKYSVHGGAKIPINEEEKDEFQRKFITATFNYRGQREFDQLDIGVYYTQWIVSFGIWYRGIPTKHYQPGYPNNDALCFIVGMKNDKMNFGYSYDLTISGLSRLSNGAHEITASYQLCKLSTKKKPRVSVPCPKF
jgi:type IX secretion system PorP/SprF family membrane protein